MSKRVLMKLHLIYVLFFFLKFFTMPVESFIREENQLLKLPIKSPTIMKLRL